MYGVTKVFHANVLAYKNPNVKYIINIGSSRSSKTWSILELLHQIASHNDNYRITAWRDTKTSCRATLWKDYIKILRISNRFNSNQRNKNEATYSFPNGSYIEFQGTDDEEKVHGLTQNISWLNEPYNISKQTFDQLDMRSDIIFIDYNPKKGHWVEDLLHLPNTQVIHSTYKDNPYCPANQRQKIESYQPTTHAKLTINKVISLDLANAYAKNVTPKRPSTEQYTDPDSPLYISDDDWEEFMRTINNERNKTADLYMWEVYGLGKKAENQAKIYKGWRQISNDYYNNLKYPEYFGLDFGFTAPCPLVGCKIDVTNKIFYIKLYSYTPISQMQTHFTDYLKKAIPNNKHNIPIICDSADPQRRIELHNANFNAIPALKFGQNNVSQSISLLQNSTIFYVEDPNLQDEYDNYSWEIVNNVNLDRPIKKNDHALDAIRYVITWLYRYYNIQPD